MWPLRCTSLQLYAATQRGLHGGEVVGPRFYLWGSPVIETDGHCALGAFTAEQCKQQDLDALWAQSEWLSGVSF